MSIDMIKPTSLVIALMIALLSGCTGSVTHDAAARNYEDLAVTKPVTDGQVYRISNSGICGTVEADHILVTYVIKDSVADGKIRKGDKIIALQHRGLGSNIPAMVAKRVYRLGRDWDWHFYVTVDRPSLRRGKGNVITFDLRVPPTPGNVCHFGPTGFFAKRYADRLLVEVVEADSPSDGKLSKGDIILAVDGRPITGDAYALFTDAIDRAEAGRDGGLLKLTVTSSAADAQAKPAPRTVDLQLKVLGSHSATAPIDCAKTDALITQAADYLATSKKYGRLQAGLLGLLATGEPKYIKVVRDHLHAAEWARPPADVNDLIGNTSSSTAWMWGYQTLVLTEYYLLTGDKYVLPAITRYARGLAAGQDQAGLWGHRMCHPAKGRAFGYGVMNQPSLTIFIALILADRCGIDDPTVRAAIKRTHDHYDHWVGRGALPYGNHGPMEHMFTNNGTSGSLAVAFALLGNKNGAQFYSQMSAAATDEILTGHSGPWWNILWSGLGANVSGPHMAAAYNRKLHWLRTMARTWNGRHVDMLGWGSKPQAGRLSDTGSHLLNLCVGRRAIHITGKGMDRSLWLTREQAGQVIKAGAIDTSSTSALLKQLGSALPPVRVRAAQHLAIRDANVTRQVMDLLTKGNTHQRIGAIHAIQNLKIASAASTLAKIVVDERDDIWIRQKAAGALSGMEDTRRFAPDVLAALVRDKPYDRFGEFDRDLGGALVRMLGPNPHAAELDEQAYYRAVDKLLAHPHGWGRMHGMALVKDIPLAKLPRVADMMIHVIEDGDRGYTFYGDHGRQDGLNTLYRLGIKESIELTVNTIKEPTGRGGARMRARMSLLKQFGGEAKFIIPRLREALGKNADAIVEQIEAASTTKPMITLEQAKQQVAP
jgi:hypothetical protein